MARVLPSNVETRLVPGPARTRIAVVTPPEPTRQVLAFMGYAGFLNRFELQRFELLAHLWRARIVVPEVPGCGGPGSRVSFRQGVALLRGDYGPTVRPMLTAALEQLTTDTAIDVLGYSMGCSLAAAALASPQSRPIGATRLVLVEPVAIQRWSALRLLRSTRVEDGLTATYIADTLAWAGAAPPPGSSSLARITGEQTIENRLSMLLLANALRRGTLLRDLTTGLSTRPGMSVTVVSGATSRLSASASVARFVEQVGATSTSCTWITVEGAHSLWHSLDMVRDLAPRVYPSDDTTEV